MYSILRFQLKLTSIFLSENEIKVIKDGDLNVLSALKELHLDHNKITDIQANALNGLKKLEKLYLNHNQLYYLPEALFEHWPINEIKAVDLSGE